MNQTRSFSKNKYLYLAGQLTSQLGSNLFLIAMVIWLKETHGSSTFIGLFLFTAAITNVVFSPFAGVWVDRLGPKRVMIGTDIINGLIMISISLIMNFAQTKSWVFTAVIALTFLSSCMNTLFSPASMGLIGKIVSGDDVKDLTGWSSNIIETSKIIGRSLGGILAAIIAPSILIFLNGLSFLISALLETNIVIIDKEQGNKNNQIPYFKQLKEGAHFLKTNMTLMTLFLGAAATNFFMAINGPLLPTLIKDLLGQELWWYGIIMSATGAGALLGGYLARKLSKETCRSLLNPALILQGLPFFFIPLCQHPTMIFALLFLVGLFFVFVQVNMLTLVSQLVPAELRGRVFALMFAIVGLFMPLSYLITGGLADYLKAEVINLYYIAGLGIPAVWLFAIPRLGARGASRPIPNKLA